MSLQPLSAHRGEVVFGKPLPFGICDAEGRLLLARGHVIQSEDQLETLLDRGAFVERSASDGRQRVAQARPDQLPGLWDDGIDQIGQFLRASIERDDFGAALDEATGPVMALIERDPDLAIFQIVRQDESQKRQYASRHAVHTGIAGCLAAKRLGWNALQQRNLMRAALTMNMSMTDLQNRLATQMSPPTTLQRQQIKAHPQRSAELLQAAGVKDQDWLDAVLHHHEYGDGTGYPFGHQTVGELAQLLQRADVFTAKFAARAERRSVSADQAARTLYLRDKGHPMTAALIKEFGLYPPGCAVQLASGELGFVARRGDTSSTPLVVVFVSRSGEPVITPVVRRTSQPAHAIAAVISPTKIKVMVPLEKIIGFVSA